MIYESIVYPSYTEEIYTLELEKESEFRFNNNFDGGFFLKEINRGDERYIIGKIT